MSDKYILDEHGEPIECHDLMQWAEWYESRKQGDARWIVGKDKFGEVEVSTVFLALNHGYGDGPPLLYETMVFGGKHDNYCERYSTRVQALA